MSKEILATKTVDKTQFQLYKVKILYPARYMDSRKGIIYQEDVLITTYGITAATYEGYEELYYDSGPLSTHNYLVNALFHRLYKLELQGVEHIQKEVRLEYQSWCNNQYGNPFSKIANQKLKRKIQRTYSMNQYN